MTAQFSCMYCCNTSMSYFFGSLVKTKQLFLSVLVYGRKTTFDYSVFKYCFRWLKLISSSENLNPGMFQKEKIRTSRHKLAQWRRNFTVTQHNQRQGLQCTKRLTDAVTLSRTTPPACACPPGLPWAQPDRRQRARVFPCHQGFAPASPVNPRSRQQLMLLKNQCDTALL